MNKLDTFQYSGHFLPKTPAIRNYLLFDLKENRIQDSLKLLLIENILKGIEQSKDTTYGVKVVFQNKLKYRTIIAAINACLKSDINTYFLRSDTLISYHRLFTEKDDITSKYPNRNRRLGPWICCGVSYYQEPPKQSFFDKIMQYKTIILISLPYAIWLLIIAVFMIRRLNKK